jgi:exodeoxyribonuclease-3
MRIASWNVNSVRSRLDQLGAWLARSAPDVICLQETKAEDEKFPMRELEEVGYRFVTLGQKTYNGVAIGARFGLAIDDVKRNLDGDDGESQKRAIAATIEGIRVINVYVPNGQSPDAPAFTYKLEWLARLRRELEAHHTNTQDVFLCGDFNVAPESIDVHDPPKWEGGILVTPEERAALRNVMDFGLIDTFRAHHDGAGLYSWWDYRMGAFRKNHGARIDLALVTKSLAARCTAATIDRRPRELDRPSDHAPVLVDIG